MLSNTRLLKSLDMLEYYYRKVANPPPPPAPREPGDPAQFCKYAALELCGWIEEAQDYIILEFRTKLSEQKFITAIEDMVKKNYGFDLYFNFLPMIGFGVGVANYEKMVQNFSSAPGAKFINMQTLLGSGDYKKLRNTHAHTHFDETVPDKLQRLNSPAVVKQHAQIIFDGFDELFKKLKTDSYL
jgi:hypothetical protein